MISSDDLVLLLSKSGNSPEFELLLPALQRRTEHIMGMTSEPESTLAQFAKVALIVPVEREACPMNLAPTASTTAMLAMGTHWP